VQAGCIACTLERLDGVQPCGGCTPYKLARTKLVGRWKLLMQVQMASAAYNLVRMRRLLATG